VHTLDDFFLARTKIIFLAYLVKNILATLTLWLHVTILTIQTDVRWLGIG